MTKVAKAKSNGLVEPDKALEADLIKLHIRITGFRALLMHNGRLADPMNEFSERMKELTSKKKKTRTDFEAIQRLEFEGGMYHDKDLGPYLPAANIEACIADGARKSRQGQEALMTVTCEEPMVPLVYDGPRDIEGLWADTRFRDVRSVVNPSTRWRNMRCRPFFAVWSADVTIGFDPEDADAQEVFRWFETAGRKVGICDGTPKYGRFRVKLSDE